MARSSAVVRRWFNRRPMMMIYNIPYRVARINHSINHDWFRFWILLCSFNWTLTWILTFCSSSVELRPHTHSAAPSTCTTHVNSCRWGIIGDGFIAPARSRLFLNDAGPPGIFPDLFNKFFEQRFPQFDARWWVLSSFFSFWYDFDTQSQDQ